MSECSDQTQGALLHAYELGILADSELEAFELHLMECDHCLEELSHFSRYSDLLADSVRVRQAISDLAGKSVQQTRSSRIVEYLWPKVPLCFRPALLLGLLCLSLIPAYWGLRPMLQPERITLPRTVLVTTQLDGTHVVLKRSEGERVALVWEVLDLQLGSRCWATLADSSHRLVDQVSEPVFVGPQGVVTIEVDLSKIDDGTYTLSLTDGPESDWSIRGQQIIRVED